jgi:hypothetical protein
MLALPTTLCAASVGLVTAHRCDNAVTGAQNIDAVLVSS